MGLVLKSNFKLIMMLFIIGIIIISMSIVIWNVYNHQPSAAIPYESSITPFNITTTLTWDRFSFSGSIDQLMPNSVISGQNGLETQFYATQLPLFQFYNNVIYSIKILKLDGPSNISITLTGSQNEITFYKGMKSLSENPEQIIINNPLENKTYTGVLQVQQTTFYNKNTNLFPNTTRTFEYEYNSFNIQPNPMNYPIWDHSLTIKVSLSGYEDRPLFNYFRKIHGYPIWNDTDFQPLNMEQSDNTGTNRSYSFAPSSNVAGFTTPSWLIYVDNQSKIMNDNLKLKVTLQTIHPVNLILSFRRELIVTYDNVYGYDVIVSKSISRYPIYNNAILNVNLNWNKINFINATILKITKNDTNDYLYVYTTLPGGDFSIGHQMHGGNETLANYTFNYISAALENPSNASQWDNRGKLSTEVSWGQANMSVAPDNIVMYGNNGYDTISINYNLTITSSKQVAFSTDFFVLTIVLLAGKKVCGKKFL